VGDEITWQVVECDGIHDNHNILQCDFSGRVGVEPPSRCFGAPRGREVTKVTLVPEVSIEIFGRQRKVIHIYSHGQELSARWNTQKSQARSDRVKPDRSRSKGLQVLSRIFDRFDGCLPFGRVVD
jgi:hypothetical protein